MHMLHITYTIYEKYVILIFRKIRYNEVCTERYQFTNSAPYSTLHFTQVVWAGSRELGIGMATGKKNGMTCTYVVGRYRPAGNMGGQYKANVPKGSFTQGVCSSLDKMVKEIEKSSGDGRASGVGEVPPPPLPSNGSGKGGRRKPGSPSGSRGDSKGSSSKGAMGSNFQKSGLAAHNKFRKIHGTSALTLNQKMCREAEDYAKVLARKGGLQHASVKDGENLAYACSGGSGNGFNGAEATKNWFVLELNSCGCSKQSASFSLISRFISHLIQLVCI